MEKYYRSINRRNIKLCLNPESNYVRTYLYNIRKETLGSTRLSREESKKGLYTGIKVLNKISNTLYTKER